MSKSPKNTPESPVRWAERVSPGEIRRLYEADARGLADEDQINEVGYALYARCETIRRVTQRCCPDCGEPLRGEFKGESRIGCSACSWAGTWKRYHRSYKGRRIHGGRAFPAFQDFLTAWPRARSVRDKMQAIDRLIHAVHEGAGAVWTLPAAVNLIDGKNADILGLLDALASIEGARPDVIERFRRLRGRLERSEATTREFYEARGKARADRDRYILPPESEEL